MIQIDNFTVEHVCLNLKNKYTVGGKRAVHCMKMSFGKQKLGTYN